MLKRLLVLLLFLAGATVGSRGILAEEFWCEGVDDDGDGEIDEGCNRTCLDPFPLAGPVVIAPDAIDSTSVSLVRPGTGLAFAYADARAGTSQVYVQVTATSGAVDEVEVLLSDGTNPAYSPDLTWREDGKGYGFAWVDERSGNPEVLFRMLSPSGQPSGPLVTVSSTGAASLNPAVAWTGSEFLVAWDDEVASNRDLYVRRISSFGVPVEAAKRVTTDGAIQEDPSLAWDSTQYALAWTDERDGNREIYAVRLDTGGNVVGSQVRITSAAGASERPSVVARAVGDFGVGWEDDRDGTDTIWYGRWTSPGYTAPAGVEVSAGAAASRIPSLMTTGAEMLLAWEDLRHGPGEVYLRRLDADGVFLSPEVRLTTGAEASGPSAVWHGSGIAVAYSGLDGGTTAKTSLVLGGCCEPDGDTDGWKVCDGDCNDAGIGQNPGAGELCDGLDTNCDGVQDEGCRGTCNVNLPTPPEEFYPSPQAGKTPEIVWDGGGYGVAWLESDVIPGCCIEPAVFFRRLDSDGHPLTSAVRLTPAGLFAEAPSLVWTGTEYAAAWRQYGGGGPWNIAFARIDASGVPVGTAKVVTQAPPTVSGYHNAVLVWRGDEYGLIFEEWNGGSVRAVLFQRLDREGRPVERARDVTPSSNGWEAHLAADGEGYALSYIEFDNPFFRRLDRFGGYLAPAVQLRSDPFSQYWTWVEPTPWGYGMVWVDETGGTSGHTHYQKLDADGTPLGAPLDVQTPFTGNSFPPRLRWIGQEFLVVFMESSDRVMMARLNENGVRLGPDLWVDQGSDEVFKGNPNVVWNGIRPAVVWQDERTLGLNHPRPMISLQTCCEDVSVASVADLSWTGSTSMVWATNGSERYDRVRGDLLLVRDSGGDWEPSVIDCQNDLPGPTSEETLNPPPQAAYYYLVRGDSVCGAGSYDTGYSGQQGSRDSGINGSVNACP